MNPKTSEEKALLKRHLYPQRNKNGSSYFSALIAALRDSRKATNRGVVTGIKIKGRRHSSWLGALGYLVILDQVGDCFKPISKSEVIGSSIEKALSYFSKLSQLERDAIYALRCAFAHDYGLSNICVKKSKIVASKTHRFIVVADATNPLVVLPKNNWGGDYNDNDLAKITTVNLEVLGDTIESIVAEVRALEKKNELEVILDGGFSELGSYSFYSK